MAIVSALEVALSFLIVSECVTASIAVFRKPFTTESAIVEASLSVDVKIVPPVAVDHVPQNDGSLVRLFLSVVSQVVGRIVVAARTSSIMATIGRVCEYCTVLPIVVWVAIEIDAVPVLVPVD